MDTSLHSAWQSCQPPFAGEVLRTADLVPLDLLQPAVACVVSRLYERFGDKELWSLEDWHEHDGYLTQAKRAAWEEVLSTVSSPSSLYENRCADDSVRRTFFDRPSTFLLRIWIPEENDDVERYQGKWGDFDVSGPAELLDELAGCIAVQTQRERAGAFFRKHYAG